MRKNKYLHYSLLLVSLPAFVFNDEGSCNHDRVEPKINLSSGITCEYDDATKTCTYSDGTKITINFDGSKTIDYPDGTQEISKDDRTFLFKQFRKENYKMWQRFYGMFRI